MRPDSKSNKAASPKVKMLLIVIGALAVLALLFIGAPALMKVMSGASATSSSQSGASNTQTSTVSTTTKKIEYGAKSPMFSNSLQVVIEDAQRRPLSTFSGASVTGKDSGSVTATDTTDIVIEVDMGIEWNENTYKAALGSSASIPSTVGDLFSPGKLMYIKGKDSNGGDYISYDVLKPSAAAQTGSTNSSSSGSTLTNASSWDYDLLSGSMPPASTKKEGSILFKVSSTAQDLVLYIISPEGVAVSDEKSIAAANKTVYTLPLS